MNTNIERRGSLERFLCIFADVRRGEVPTALLLMLNVFILLTAYYIIKPVREALILGSGTAEIKSYAGAAQALLFMVLVPLYSTVANRVSRVVLVNGVTAFFISNLVIFYALGQLNVPIAVPFFIWVGLFNVMLIAQVWAFANDIYSEEQGKRLLVITGIGSSLGAILGADLAGRLFKPLGAYPMMLVAASLLSICMVLTVVVHRRENSRRGAWVRQSAEEPPAGERGGFQLVFRYRYLLLIAGMVLLTNLVNTTGEFILGKAVKQSAEAMVGTTGVPQEEFIGQFYARFFFWVNVLGAAFQLFLVSRIQRYFDIGAALMFLPILALGSYTLLAFMPVLSLVRGVKMFENATDYSIQNTARHSLFLSSGRDAKYKAKTAIDNFFWRAGDALSAMLVFVGTQFAMGLRGFSIVNIVLVCVWLAVTAGILMERRKQEPAMPESAAPESAAA